MSNLSGRSVLVTGAGHGMGRAHCIELARRGAIVGINDLDEQAAEDTAEAVRAEGGTAISVVGDVSDRAVVEGFVQSFADFADGIDCLVSNAGTIHSNTGLADTDDADWWRTFHVHVGGALNTSRACLPWLQRSEAGRIVIISSMWGQTGFRHSHAYGAAKGALIAFSKGLAKELGQYGICVNNIAPGGVYTRMTAPPAVSQEEIDDECAREIPLGRYAQPEEISHMLAFLASTESGFVTGQTLAVNGGQAIGGF
ncbi:SDR family NAD(P)-dependent oxidoreductase [Mycobacterium sp. smrl_JER01]|uniref:SDR family NAD(P)-dependent oxidoreductase n=1 Tax=Mycobacterium sp. smrl_JER01 TaxID=3402633 RepID=UPI003AD6B96F